ncbi:glycosyltransferase family 62 protein [Thermothielavioides terrestris NRRL 8126]|uniref:Glycosyltransferase family 62 protein n=1 Tax=Thermothielavioides terrestris (strain ATCC 38088 / NRRL 8126) TaxID=578455 RepID=G2QTH6_THETT|nr:glycosyltransferase family 62 protein [Thermothielavioides terrestris NRRL 8126]AEO63593.1 glycosyltransferase family 62 protein [Thermothielavioides terrestris NRRL 8126]
MLLPKGGVSWKAARASLPPTRAIWMLLTRTRFLLLVALAGAILLLWRCVRSSASGMQSFYCWGPSKSPMEMTPNEQAAWNAHLRTPVLFNHHAPVEVNSSTVQHVDLNVIKSTTKAVENRERVLILTPLKDAAPHLPRYFELITNLTYPHDLIDLAFLVSDSTDETLAVLAAELDRIQKSGGSVPFRSATVVEKDFGFKLSQAVDDRHGFEIQAPRRKALARARNYLLSTALRPDHSWVYWRDVDIVECPADVLEDFIAHDRDILVPNIWFHRFEDGRDIEGRFDYNSWVESNKARRLASKLSKDDILVEGYKKYYDTGRKHMALMGDWRGNKHEEIELDGIGGVNIIVKADVHRSGINFPCYAFENQAETEGFAKMAKRAGYGVYGLPNYVVWHIDTEEKDDHKY